MSFISDFAKNLKKFMHLHSFALLSVFYLLVNTLYGQFVNQKSKPTWNTN